MKDSLSPLLSLHETNKKTLMWCPVLSPASQPTQQQRPKEINYRMKGATQELPDKRTQNTEKFTRNCGSAAGKRGWRRRPLHTRYMGEKSTDAAGSHRKTRSDVDKTLDQAAPWRGAGDHESTHTPKQQLRYCTGCGPLRPDPENLQAAFPHTPRARTN